MQITSWRRRFSRNIIISLRPVKLRVQIDDQKRGGGGEKTSTPSVTSPEGRAPKRRCRRASDNFLMEPLSVVCPFDCTLEPVDVFIYIYIYWYTVLFRGSLEETPLPGLILSRWIFPRGIHPISPTLSLYSSVSERNTRRTSPHATLFSPAHGTGRKMHGARCESAKVEASLSLRFTTLRHHRRTRRGLGAVESVRIEWATIICQARTSAR